MSIEVRIPKEIMEYKEKIIFGLSLRQLLCFIIALSIGGLTYYFTLKASNEDTAGYAAMFIVMPIFAVGFFKINGFTFEKYVALMVRHRFGTNRRNYKTELLVDEIPDETIKKPKKERGVWNVFTFSKKDKKTDRIDRECKVFEVTAKSRKRKSQEAIREIEAARKEHRAAKYAAKKAVKKGSSSTDCTADD